MDRIERDGARRAGVGRLTAGVDRRRQRIAEERPRIRDRRILREPHVTEVVPDARAVPRDLEKADVDIPRHAPLERLQAIDPLFQPAPLIFRFGLRLTASPLALAQRPLGLLEPPAD